MKIRIKEVGDRAILYRDDKTGIAWVEDSRKGLGYSAHPNIDSTGSVSAMKTLGYWRKEDRTVQSHGFIYNIDQLVISSNYDDIARQHCNCGGDHPAPPGFQDEAGAANV